MRTDIRFILTCSECGNELEADTEGSKIECNSAAHASARMAIKPCATCYSKAREPADLIGKALKLAYDQGSET